MEAVPSAAVDALEAGLLMPGQKAAAVAASILAK
jgi:hypothetical protein